MDAAALKNFITELLATLGVPIESVVVTGGHRTVVAVTTPEPDVLIGPNGDHLRALTMLARRIVEAKHGEVREHLDRSERPAATFIIDINGRQEALLEGVRGQARILPQRVRLFKHDAELTPMSSYERLVVHELFADDPEIKTESAGEGKFRHVVLKYSAT